MTEKEMLQVILDVMQDMRVEMQGMNARIESLESRTDNLEAGLCENNNRLSKVEQRLNQMQYMLENEIRKGIQIIGEGHASLDRKLNAALEVRAEREQLELRVLSLEVDMKNVKKQVLHGV